MKSLLRFIGQVLFFLAVASSMEAQQGHPMAIGSVRTEFDDKINPELPWVSEYAQPFIYQLWWSEIAQCEGLPLPVEKTRKVQFFQVNAPDFIPQDVDAVVYAVTYGQSYDGQTYVAYPYLWNRLLIEHEMLHQLLMWWGDPLWFDHGPRFETCGLHTYGPPTP